MSNERLRKTVDALCEHIANEEGLESLYAILGSAGLSQDDLIELGWMQKE